MMSTQSGPGKLTMPHDFACARDLVPNCVK